MNTHSFQFQLPARPLFALKERWQKYWFLMWILVLVLISLGGFVFFYNNHLGLAYNDARSHLDIGRRVVEGLKPGFAQLGSVWLPLPHVLMVPTIWNDFFWHSGLSGAIQSMASFILTCAVIYKILKLFNVDEQSAWFGSAVFAANLNILYLQSTAMTELLLIGTMTIASYQLLKWSENATILNLTKTAFWIMLATLIRYDGWFLFLYAVVLIVGQAFFQNRKKFLKAVEVSEGHFVLFCTLAGFGIFLWFLWNALIFKDPLYFAFGPYSAHAQQAQLADSGVLITLKNMPISLLTYWFAMLYNCGVVPVIMALFGMVVMLADKKLKPTLRVAATVLLIPFLFNVVALYLGHSVLFIQNLNGNTWFNVRYGIMMMPSVAIFSGYLFYRMKALRPILLGVFVFISVLQFVNFDAVTIDDGRVGSSQKNVSEVSGWLSEHAKDEKGFVLISAASHDAIIFSSGLPMKKFIHEGTGGYWTSATTAPDRWARWIVMRTNDSNDQTFKLVNQTGQLFKYQLVRSYPFADIYELRPEYLPFLNTEPVLGKQK